MSTRCGSATGRQARPLLALSVRGQAWSGRDRHHRAAGEPARKGRSKISRPATGRVDLGDARLIRRPAPLPRQCGGRGATLPPLGTTPPQCSRLAGCGQDCGVVGATGGTTPPRSSCRAVWERSHRHCPRKPGVCAQPFCGQASRRTARAQRGPAAATDLRRRRPVRAGLLRSPSPAAAAGALWPSCRGPGTGRGRGSGPIRRRAWCRCRGRR
jgi:hypothetical protein